MFNCPFLNVKRDYVRLSYERKKSSAKNKLNKSYNERTQQLIEIGEKNPFKQ